MSDVTENGLNLMKVGSLDLAFIQVGPYQFHKDGTVTAVVNTDEAANQLLTSLRKQFPDFFKTDISHERMRAIRDSLYVNELDHLADVKVSPIVSSLKIALVISITTTVTIGALAVMVSTGFQEVSQSFKVGVGMATVFSGVVSVTTLAALHEINRLYRWCRSNMDHVKARIKQAKEDGKQFP